MRFLLGCGARPNEQSDHGNTPLTMAARRGYADLVRLLLSFGAEVDHRGEADRTALGLIDEGLALARSSGGFAMREPLLENGTEK